MKRLLFIFALLFTVPFNSSCIKEITIDVVVAEYSYCTYEKPIKKAVFGREYRMKIVPDQNYELNVNDGELEVMNEDHILTILGDKLYNQKTDELIIPGNYVTSKITIKANAQLIEL